ncbi:hypothetical protein KCV87_32130 [Actinosynnema pretiosum subsp. pretiosum]|uniref:Uncharacterized protein n=1 Tax=Actinosynnema pretiosum subsp. pretiosum TaxID=103721 RepID=A0AA45L600_9PSEU|nr:hypothetical protein APASM_4713 [Actinosynnema pretiosum subsp. pretiosum]QUF03952.1 hypothetical protein KCV87_32130 [Actinosynnema pretiosum subsp. pretiosum]
MQDLAALFTAIAGLVTALGGAFVLVFNTVRMSRRERPAAAQRVAEVLAQAAADGEITSEALAEALARLREEGET